MRISISIDGYYFATTQEVSQVALTRSAMRVVLKGAGVIVDAELVELVVEELYKMALVYPGFSQVSEVFTCD